MTQIEKEAFLGNYIGCEIEWLRESDNKWLNTYLTASDFSFLVKKKCRLIAKPLESITDDDAVELFYLVDKYNDDGLDVTFPNSEKIKFVKEFISNKNELMSIGLAEIIISFLRSKGYLLPFRQYSTERLIESGIAKI